MPLAPGLHPKQCLAVKTKNEGGGSWTRREAIAGLGALLAASSWPTIARAKSNDAGEYAFVVANDFHHDSEECDSWFERLFRQIGRHPELAFCAGLGDLANKGRPESIAAINRLSAVAGVPFYPLPGNHDNDLDADNRVFAEVLPGRLNYAFTHGGWQFLAIDTTDGKAWHRTRVSAATLAWLDNTLPTLDAKKPTVLFTHFPLTPIRDFLPLNANEVLERFERANLNLRAAFTGHYHGKLRGRRGATELLGNVCCSRVAKNADGSLVKGYWLCRAHSDGALTQEFVEFAG